MHVSARCTLDPCCLLQVDEIITKMSRKGMTPSMIGVVLRDSHGVPQVGSVTGSKVLRILKKNGLAPEIPEDLYYMIKKAVVMRKHLEVNRKDKDGKFRLILVESRIHRLARYYKVRAHTEVLRLVGVITSNLSRRAACPVRPCFSKGLGMSSSPLWGSRTRFAARSLALRPPTLLTLELAWRCTGFYEHICLTDAPRRALE